MGRPTTLPEPWCSLADRLGGVGAAAALWGVTPRTVGRWATREMGISGPARALVLQSFRDVKIDPPEWLRQKI